MASPFPIRARVSWQVNSGEHDAPTSTQALGLERACLAK